MYILICWIEDFQDGSWEWIGGETMARKVVKSEKCWADKYFDSTKAK
jgi:hypothetical protein